MLSELHKYREIVTDDTQCLQVPESERLIKDTSFQPSFQELRNAVPNARDVTSTSQTPKWDTFKPETAANLQAELELSVHLHINRRMDLLPRAWRSEFLRTGLLVKRRASQDLFFSMGCIGVSCPCLWPAVSTTVGKNEVFGFKPLSSAAELEWAPVLKFSEWWVVPTHATCPMEIWFGNDKRLPEVMPREFCSREQDLRNDIP